MKQASTPKGKPRFRLRLEHAAVFFVVAAVLFFGYSVFQASGSSSSSSSSGGGGGGLITQHNSGGLHRRTLVRVGAEEDGSGEGDGQVVAKPCPKAEQVVKTETVTVTKLVYGSTLQNPRAYHVVTTVAGFSNHWQARIHYYWFKKQRDACLREPACDMGGFTRVLHTGACMAPRVFRGGARLWLQEGAGCWSCMRRGLMLQYIPHPAMLLISPVPPGPVALPPSPSRPSIPCVTATTHTQASPTT